jgi:hypothetical protein
MRIIETETIIHFFFLSKKSSGNMIFISIAAFSLCQQTMKLIIERLNRTLVGATYSHRGLSPEDKLRLFSIKKPNTFPVYYCPEIQPKPPLRLIPYIIVFS